MVSVVAPAAKLQIAAKIRLCQRCVERERGGGYHRIPGTRNLRFDDVGEREIGADHQRSLKIDAEILVALGVAVGQLICTAIDGHRLRQLEDFFAAGRLVMKIQERRSVRVYLALPGTGEPENVGLEHVVLVCEMKNEAADADR